MMRMGPAPGSTPRGDWAEIDGRMRVVRLSLPLRVSVPLLGISSLPKRTRGLTLFSGLFGLGIGALLSASSIFIAFLMYTSGGVIPALLSIWVLGTAGIVTLAAAASPTAFVKPICVDCRLLPIIREHEAIHLSGVSSEKSVWASMKTRHSIQSLHLAGDPAICSFCPIPKRLAEQ